MKKGMLIALVVALVLAVAVPAAMAINDTQKAELQKLYEQEQQIRQQILEKQVEAGLIDADKAEAIRQRLAERWEFRKQRMAEGDYSFGFGRRGNGCGKGYGRGFGRGFDRRGGGCGNCPQPESPSNTSSAL